MINQDLHNLKQKLYRIEDKLANDAKRMRAEQVQFAAGVEKGIDMTIRAIRDALNQEQQSVVNIDPVHAAGGCYCRECKFYAPAGGGVGDCERESVQYLNVSDTDFCSLGKERDDDDEPV